MGRCYKITTVKLVSYNQTAAPHTASKAQLVIQSLFDSPPALTLPLLVVVVDVAAVAVPLKWAVTVPVAVIAADEAITFQPLTLEMVGLVTTFPALSVMCQVTLCSARS